MSTFSALCWSLLAANADAAPAAPVIAAKVVSAADGQVGRMVYPFVILVVVGLAIPIGMMLANYFLSRAVHGRRNTSPGKIEPYEGGLNATVGTANERFSVKFYLIGMLFLAFDLEVAFLYPWAVHFKNGGWAMIWLLLAFLLMLEVGYLYLWKKGALDWDR